MKHFSPFLFICSLLWGPGTSGQQALDTLYANDAMNVALFFPSPIQQAITGNDDFVFTYNREEAGHLGLLQGVEGPDSNLLVITHDGLVYAYILTHAKEIPKLNYFIQVGEHLGSERPIVDNVPLGKTSQKDSVLTMEMAQRLLDTASKTLARKRKKGLVFRLEDIHYHRNEVYLVCGLKNRSGIDFEIGYLEVLLANGSQKRRTSYQETSLNVKHTIGLPRTLKDGEESRFVVILSKFVLGEKERLKLIMGESRGNRRVVVVR